MAELVRTFIAVEIPPEIRERAAKLIARLRSAPVKATWVAPQTLHWTLKFLGDVRLVDLPEICQAVTAAVEPLVPFDLVAFGAGAFPASDRPRTVWIGTDEGTEAMVALHDAVERALLPLGFRREGRRFRPHLTIGRIRQAGPGAHDLARLLQENADFDGGLSTVFEVAIMSSQLTKEGPLHEPLGFAELKGKGDEDLDDEDEPPSPSPSGRGPG